MSETLLICILTFGIPAVASVVIAIINNFKITKNTKELSDTNKELASQREALNQAFRDIMRRDIVDLYYRRKEQKWLYQYERESLDAEYEGYHDGFHGNSFVSDIYEEMREWEIKR